MGESKRAVRIQERKRKWRVLRAMFPCPIFLKPYPESLGWSAVCCSGCPSDILIQQPSLMPYNSSPILRISVSHLPITWHLLTFFSWENSKALIRPVSSAFWAEVVTVRVWAFVTFSMVTTTHLASLWLLCMNLLPSIYNSQANSFSCWSTWYDLLE